MDFGKVIRLTKLLPTMTPIRLNYINVSDYSENVKKRVSIWDKTYLKNDYQFFIL